MWTERVDSSVLENTIWPRAASVSEILWTPIVKHDLVRAEARLETFRCILLTRGIAAAPVNNAQAREGPPEPGSCYDQRRRR
jgi:hexosaminidase